MQKTELMGDVNELKYVHVTSSIWMTDLLTSVLLCGELLAVFIHVHACDSACTCACLFVCVCVCKCRRVILPVSYFWHGCVVSQAAAQLVNINAVWRSDGDWS